MEGAEDTEHLSPALLSGSQRPNSICTSCTGIPGALLSWVDGATGQKGWIWFGLVGFKPLLEISFKHLHFGSRAAALLHSLLAGAKELEEEGEDVDDVQVDVEGSEDVFLRAERVPAVPHQHLGIECQEHSEDNGTEQSVDRVEPRDILVGQYHSQDNATEEEDHEHHEEHPLVRGEVKLGLEAEDHDRQTHQGSDSQAQED